jgi:hypothetical protein
VPVRHLELEDDVDGAAELAEHLVERLCLCEVARVAVEDEAGNRVSPVETIADERDRDLVGNELARREQRLDQLAELRAARDRLAIQVAARDMRDPVGPRDLLRLRALPAPLRPEDEDVQRKNPS